MFERAQNTKEEEELCVLQAELDSFRRMEAEIMSKIQDKLAHSSSESDVRKHANNVSSVCFDERTRESGLAINRIVGVTHGNCLLSLERYTLHAICKDALHRPSFSD